MTRPQTDKHMNMHDGRVRGIITGDRLNNIIRINAAAAKNFTNRIAQFRTVCFRGVQVEAAPCG